PRLGVALPVGGGLGAARDELIRKPCRAAGSITTAIGSIALTIAIENVVRFSFGNELRGYDLPIHRDLRFQGIRIGPQQLENLALAFAALAAVFCFLPFPPPPPPLPPV